MPTGWNKVLEYAKMSENAYGDNLDISPWEKIDTAEHPSSGYGAVAYYNPATGEVVIAHRGTSDRGDLFQDAGMYLFNAKGEQSKLALEFTNHIKANYPGANITHTGHSLGGSIANFMAKEDPSSSAIAFDPLGTASVSDFVNKIVKGNDKHTNIVNFISDPNIINGGKPHAGKVIQLGYKNPLIPKPVKSHNLVSYIIPLIENKVNATQSATTATQVASTIQSKLTPPLPANVYVPRQCRAATSPTPCQPTTPTAQEFMAMIKTYRPGQN